MIKRGNNMKEQVVLASNNKNKIREFSEILADKQILSMSDIGYKDDVEETGETFLENALIKARTISEFLKSKGEEKSVFADDSGLCVVALNGEPGVYSARYAGGHGRDEDNRQKLLSNLKDKEDRTAYFVCVVVKLNPDGTYSYSEGRTYGHILEEKSGENGFAYDCLFFSDELGKSFGEASSEEKNSVSHRAKAIRTLKNIM